jgi:TorA maturation chaperone TorD
MSNNSDKLQSVAKAMQVVNQRNGFRENLKAHWFELFRVPATKRTLSLLSRYAQEHGEEAVRHWMDAASVNEIPANQVLRYITAIRPKKELEDDY